MSTLKSLVCISSSSKALHQDQGAGEYRVIANPVKIVQRSKKRLSVEDVEKIHRQRPAGTDTPVEFAVWRLLRGGLPDDQTAAFGFDCAHRCEREARAKTNSTWLASMRA